ncbi:MAG: Ferredoxin [Acidobacteria bacterium]|nr:Ferredoxin [Acidobacteriota bacterium]
MKPSFRRVHCRPRRGSKKAKTKACGYRSPSHQTDLIEATDIYRGGDPGAMARAEAIVQAHIAAEATLMAIPPAERQAAPSVQVTRSSSE